MNLLPFSELYTSSIFETGRQPAFVMLVAFLLTFIIARTYTRLARTTGWGSAKINGVHTHHLVFGLIIAFLAGAALIGFLPENDSPVQLFLAAAFGCGAALVLDEFALVFHLRDVYWEKEGRKSVDAVVIGLIFGILFLLQITPLSSNTEDFRGILLVMAVTVNLIFVLITAMKGKMYFATFGVFVPFLAQFGAIRLAEPTSAWAHTFYTDKPDKLKKSIKRYDRYRKRWWPIKERLWDIIGGKPEHFIKK